MAQVANRALIYLNGILVESKNGSTLTSGGISREPVISDNKVVGFQESIQAPMIEATFIQTADVDVANLNTFQGTITYQQDIGVTWVVQNGFSGGNAKLSKGEITVTLYGERAELA